MLQIPIPFCITQAFVEGMAGEDVVQAGRACLLDSCTCNQDSGRILNPFRGTDVKVLVGRPVLLASRSYLQPRGIDV